MFTKGTMQISTEKSNQIFFMNRSKEIELLLLLKGWTIIGRNKHVIVIARDFEVQDVDVGNMPAEIGILDKSFAFHSAFVNVIYQTHAFMWDRAIVSTIESETHMCTAWFVAGSYYKRKSRTTKAHNGLVYSRCRTSLFKTPMNHSDFGIFLQTIPYSVTVERVAYEFILIFILIAILWKSNVEL